MELAVHPAFPLQASDEESSADRRWRRALAVSLALHGLVLGALLQHLMFQPEDRSLPPLTVQLLPPPPAAAPLPQPIEEAPPPRPLERRVVETPRPDILRAPQKAVADTPPIALPPPLPVAEPAPAAAPIAVAPAPSPAQPAAKPVAEAPAPAPRTLDPSMLAGFNRAVAAALDRFKHYPRIALMRQWQGTAMLKLEIGADGRVRDFHLARSSGYDALDQEALDMLRQALPLPKVPASLAGTELSIDIPVVFKIAQAE